MTPATPKQAKPIKISFHLVKLSTQGGVPPLSMSAFMAIIESKNRHYLKCIEQ